MNLEIGVSHPVQRTDGRPLPLDELSHVTIEIGVRDDDRFYTNLNSDEVEVPVGGGPLVRVQNDIDDGEWFVRVKWFDTRGQASVAVVNSIVIGDGSLAPPMAGLVTLRAVP